MAERKNKTIYLVFFAVLLMFSLMPNVSAEKEKDTTCYSNVNISKSEQIMFRGQTINVYFMYVNGEIALCLDHGKAMRSGVKVTPGLCNKDNVSTQAKKAINYCASVGCRDDLQRISAQVYAWGGSTNDVMIAICSQRGIDPYLNFNGSKNKGSIGTVCQGIVGSYAVPLKNIWASLQSAPASGDFTCNWSGNGGQQRLVTVRKPRCEHYDVSPEQITCPPGTKFAGTDITEAVEEMGYDAAVEKYCQEETPVCVGYAVELAGSLAACSDNNQTTYSLFHEVIGPSSADYTGSAENGRKMDVNIGDGNYCAFYCLETRADATLPGGIANPITLGSALTWPTSENTSGSRWGNMFPLSFSGQKRCKLQVAPNLTFGNSCELEPVELYQQAIDKIKSYYDEPGKKYPGLKSQAQKVNQGDFLKYSGDYVKAFVAQKLTNVDWLDRNNEEIRVDTDHQTSYLNVFDVYDPGDGTMWGSNQFVERGSYNSSESEASYQAEWKGYCDAHKITSATLHYNYSCGSGLYESGGDCYTNAGSVRVGAATQTYSHSTCPNGRALSGKYDCYCTEAAANAESGKVKRFNEIRTEWKKYYTEVRNRFNRYSNYIEAYQNALGIYHQIKLCNNFGTNAGDEDEGGSDFTCGGRSCDFYNFMTNAEMEYTDEGEYGTGYGLTIEKDTSYSCTGCESDHSMGVTNQLINTKYNGYKRMINPSDRGYKYLESQIKNIENRTVEITASETTYSLPSGLYNYIDKKTNKFLMDKPDSNFETLGLDKNYDFLYSNLPTSYNNIPGKKYNLVIKSIMLGDNGQFYAEAAGVGISDYVCHYTVATDYDECLCPPGTKNAGTDLYEALLEDNLSCADAKIKYCDRDVVPECTVNCVVDKYCPNDMSVKITACVNTGMSRAACVAKMCGSGKYYCPSGTKYSGMDITACVQTRRAEGSNDAFEYCKDTVCNGAVVIYRKIDLKNPFPSIDADETVSQTGLRQGMFNLRVKGRYPGYNWNGTNLVNTEIIKNRNVNDDSVYELKPLYHFVLNAATISDIRAYNRKQAKNDRGYNDFTLSCVKDDHNAKLGASCLSSFVHNPNYGGDTSGNKSICGGAGSTSSLTNCLYQAN